MIFFFRFEKILSELESHVDERVSSGSYASHKLHLVPFIQTLLDPNEFTERLILTATAVLDNNCFEILMPLRNVEMGGLFLISLILCHDCVPNTKHYVNYIDAETDIQRYQMTFETTGEHLSPYIIHYFSTSTLVTNISTTWHKITIEINLIFIFSFFTTQFFFFSLSRSFSPSFQLLS